MDSLPPVYAVPRGLLPRRQLPYSWTMKPVLNVGTMSLTFMVLGLIFVVVNNLDQLLPENVIFFEPYVPSPPDLTSALAARGYKVETQDFNGDIEAIEVKAGKSVPGADPRARGVAMVVP